jgi:hypothetical protein
MTKKKISLEYLLTAKSGSIIWNMISTPGGLSRWFADEAELHDNVYTFRWGKDESRQAKIIGHRNGVFIRLRWLDETEATTFFELRMDKDELTGDYTLLITDFADPGEESEVKELWDWEVNTLCQTGGA